MTLHLQESLSDKISHILEKNGKTIAYAVVFVILAGALLLRWLGTSSTGGEVQDYLNMASQVRQLQQYVEAGTNTSQVLEKIETGFSDHPPLQSRYEGTVAQTLLASGQDVHVDQYVTEIDKRIPKELLKDFTHYTRGTLALAQHNYSSASQDTLSLQNQLKAEGRKETLLYLYTLMRQGVIAYKTGDKEGERIAWDTLNSYLDRQKQQPTTKLFLEHFQEGSIGLQEWIRSRH